MKRPVPGRRSTPSKKVDLAPAQRVTRGHTNILPEGMKPTRGKLAEAAKQKNETKKPVRKARKTLPGGK